MSPNDSYKQQLEQLREDYEEFIYIVSHDFKAPIRSISNLSQWIEEDLGDNLTADVSHNFQLLRNRAKRLERMLDSLLIYSRVSSNDNSLAETNVEELITEVAATLKCGINLIIPQPLPVFTTYRYKLKQVLYNLISNSVTFNTNKVASVTITCTEADDNFYEFRIADNGEGVHESAFDKIFTLFYTISSKDTLDTVGAGLAISKKIIQFVQGNISAEHNHKNGLTIRFTWPKHTDTEL
jgi:light-regulated signal transduction histidine kinase (bacteriophytochrome)